MSLRGHDPDDTGGARAPNSLHRRRPVPVTHVVAGDMRATLCGLVLEHAIVAGAVVDLDRGPLLPAIWPRGTRPTCETCGTGWEAPSATVLVRVKGRYIRVPRSQVWRS